MLLSMERPCRFHRFRYLLGHGKKPLAVVIQIPHNTTEPSIAQRVSIWSPAATGGSFLSCTMRLSVAQCRRSKLWPWRDQPRPLQGRWESPGNMPTYPEIKDRGKVALGIAIQDCWIAEVLEKGIGLNGPRRPGQRPIDGISGWETANCIAHSHLFLALHGALADTPVADAATLPRPSQRCPRSHLALGRPRPTTLAAAKPCPPAYKDFIRRCFQGGLTASVISNVGPFPHVSFHRRD